MNFVKRFVPFVAAFAVGIFVASFFVDLRGPRLFRMDMNGGRGRCRHKMRDYDRLQRENYMLRRQLEQDRFSMPQQGDLPVPPPPMTFDPATGERFDRGTGQGNGSSYRGNFPRHHHDKD